MSEPAPTSTTHPGLAGARDSRTDACAVLVLDSSGVITAANHSARTLWQCGDAELPGEGFTSLFAFEVVSLDPDFHQAQWDVLVAGARDSDVVLTAQLREGPTREVRVRIEPLSGAAGGFIATVQPISGPAPLLPTAAGPGADLFPLLATQGGVGFFDLNLVTGRVTFSPTWNRLLGYTATELPGTLETWHDLIHPDDSAAAPDNIGRKSATGTRSFSAEFRLQHQRGHWVWVQCVGVQVINAAGELERVAGINLDITERKELEDTLVANDARLQDLTGSGPLAAFELDYANRVFWFSPAFEQLLGYAEGELPADPSSFAAVLPEEDAHAGVEAWAFGRAPGLTSFTEAVTLRAKDGRPVPVVLGAHRTVNRKRDLVRLLGFACPLPVSTTEANAPRVNLTETAFHTLAEGVLITDSRRRIVFANATASRLLRLDAAALRGQPVGDAFHLVRRQTGLPAEDPVDLALSGVSALPLYSDDALVHPGEDEPPTSIVWTARAAFASDGVPQGVVIVFRNPDEMTLTPEELVKANRFESLGLLAGEIAHDINNLLTTVLGAVSMGRDNRDYSALADAEQACLTAKALTKQLLAFAKGSGGTLAVCTPKGILEDAVKMASAGSNAAIVLQVANDIQPVQVDRSQILQVFQNLIINALQAMPPPPHQARVLVRAANATLAEGQVPALVAGDYVEFEVRDNGSGIPPEHVEKIFDPFFTTKKHGTGLGLATVLSIVRKHGGQVALDTQVGVGTAFTVYLPKTDGPLEVQARRAASLRFGTGRILFMDDDANISTLTGKMLESLDYKYDLARDGDEALALYRRYLNIGRPYDAVILDLNVVGAMGGEVCFNEMRKLDPEVRAIVASGYDNDDIARKFLDQGFCGYLTKPYRVSDLGKVLKTVLG